MLDSAPVAALDDGDYPPPGSQPALDSASLKRIQTALKKLGYDPGIPDGLNGSKTVAAIKSYQKAMGDNVTGKVSWALLTDLETRLDKAQETGQPQGQPILDPSQSPSYNPLTTFVYSDGRVDRVVEIKGRMVRWQRGDSTSYTAHLNFLLPWSHWSSKTERGAITVDKKPGELWPVLKGGSVTFEAAIAVQRTDRTNNAPTKWVEKWRCENGGQSKVTVQAGTFDTVIFECRHGEKGSFGAVERTWYYAPTVRHYVRFVEAFPTDGYTKSTDLVAVVPGAPNWPPIARAALERAVLHALTKTDGDKPVSWTSSGVETRVTIEATSDVVRNAGKSCRSFVQTWSGTGSGSRHFPAVACKNDRGSWQIPGLENHPNSALAISGGVS